MRINVSLDDALIKTIDSICDSLSISRSCFISIALNEKIQKDKAIELLPEVLSLLKKQETLNKERLSDYTRD